MYQNPPTWHLYPVDIPNHERARCDVADCSYPADVVEIRAHMRGEVTPHGEPAATIYCHGHGRAAGYEQPSRVLPPEHVEAFQRLILHRHHETDAPPSRTP